MVGIYDVGRWGKASKSNGQQQDGSKKLSIHVISDGITRLPILEGEISHIELKRTTSLGVTIVGGADTPLRCVVIQEVFLDGVAAIDGRLLPGDQIVEVNGVDMTTASHQKACDSIRRNSPVLKLGIYRELVDVSRSASASVACLLSPSSEDHRPYPYPSFEEEGSGALHHPFQERDLDLGYRLMCQNDKSLNAPVSHSNQGESLSSRNHNSPVNSEEGDHSSRASGSSSDVISLCSTTAEEYSETGGQNGDTTKISSAVWVENNASESLRGHHYRLELPRVNRCWRRENEAQMKEKRVTLKKGTWEGLGMRIGGGVNSNEGDTPIYVANINARGPAGKSKQIKKGDVILSVNSTSLLGLTHTHAVLILKATLELTSVSLSFMEGPETANGVENFVPSWLYWNKLPRCLHISKVVELHRNPGSSLGFSIVGGADPERGFEPIHILFVVATSPAARDGRLRCGDRLLAVDGQCLEGVSHTTAVCLLKQTGPTVRLEIVSCLGTEL